MTGQAAVVKQVWVLDAMPLSHFARAERLDVLRDLLVDKECWTTQVVLEEVKQGVAAHPALRDVLAADWLRWRNSTHLTRSGFSRYGQAA